MASGVSLPRALPVAKVNHSPVGCWMHRSAAGAGAAGVGIDSVKLGAVRRQGIDGQGFASESCRSSCNNPARAARTLIRAAGVSSAMLKLVKLTFLLVGLGMMCGLGWLAGRSGIGSVIDPATLPPAERAVLPRACGASPWSARSP